MPSASPRSASSPSLAPPVAEYSAPWVERFARLGFAAKALLYGIVGVLALRAALGDGGVRTVGSGGALAVLLATPLGVLSVIGVAAGLFGHAAWRVVEAMLDPERKGSGPRGIAIRASYVARGLVHAWLGVEAVRLTMGDGGGESERAEHWTSRLLEAPLGTWLVGIAAASVIGYGVYQVYRGWVAKVGEHLDLARLSAEAGRWAVRISRAGIAARGLVFIVIGVLLGRAAVQRDPQEAAGTAEALRTIGAQAQGSWLLAGIAAGLIAYGVYEAIQARYRIIRSAI